MTVKNGLIIIFIVIGLYIVLDMRDHNFKRAVDACVAGSQKLSETKITDLNEAKKFCEDQIRKNNEYIFFTLHYYLCFQFGCLFSKKAEIPSLASIAIIFIVIILLVYA